MAKKCILKLILVMVKLIIIILKVHANDHTLLSSAPTPLSTNLHPFHLNNEPMTCIHRCIKSTLKECEVEHFFESCTTIKLVCYLLKDPMHPKDYPNGLFDVILKCHFHCYSKMKRFGTLHAPCIVKCYEDKMEKH
jgi:hypothetical protein